MPEIRLTRMLKVPAEPAAEALGEVLKAIADQQGPWRGFALHVSLGDLRLPDVGYVSVPIRLTAEKDSERKLVFSVAFTSANLPAAFPGFHGTFALEEAGLGESTLVLQGSYDPPMQLFGRFFDAALMPRIAQRSLANFIEEIGAACEARVNQREADFVRYRYFTQVLR
jgi:hypothetical protein